MLPIRTIVTDMDYTLLTDERIIPEATQRVVARCKERGIRFILASGRAPASLRPFVRLLDTGAPYICCNGAQTLDGKTDEMLVDLQFTHELALECIRFFEGEGMYAQYYEDDCFCYNREGLYADQYAAATMMPGRLVGPLEKALKGRTAKILGVDSPERISQAREKAKAYFGDRVAVTTSKPYFLEMNPPEATKAAALARLGETLDITPETTLAFGDSLNDLSMLTWAKYGVAMGNARNEIKAAVSLVCQTNQEQGVARFICENVLGEEFVP
ncbi:MAG: HAD family phosphatase [Clostridia bacterium]|nr:HAD family phosphatase [Clostridia bacterium]